MRSRTACALALALSSAAPAARAQIDPRIRATFESLESEGTTAPWFRASRDATDTHALPLLLRLSRPLSAHEQASLQARGGRIGGERSGGATEATLSAPAFSWLASTGAIARASVDLAPPKIARPLFLAAQATGVARARPRFRATTGETLSGKGIVVGDLDTSADVFHPAFFRPLPPVAWFDVDHDGLLTPGKDGIDLDGDGAIAPREVLRILPGTAHALFSSEVLDGTGEPRLDPGWDYLYLDENGDGRRNVGAEVEGAEAKPGMAEATFAVDDVDGDGVIRQPERLVPLGESKFKAVSHKGTVYRRGENLSQFPPVIDYPDDAAHATAVLGTIAGGQGGISRYLGHAYDADLLLVTTQWDAISLAKKLDWLLAEGANVVVTELGVWGYEVSDGSTELETAIDAAVSKGTLVVSPAGNLGISEKHELATIPVGADYVNEAVDTGAGARVVWASVTYREGGVPLVASVKVGGQLIDVSTDGTQKIDGGFTLKAVHGTTPKGSGFMLLSINRGNAPDLPASFELRLRSGGSQPLHASLFMLDDQTSWGGGWTWKQSTPVGTMCPPSFAEKTIAVGAYALHTGPGYYPSGEAEGDLRGFSGRGPDLFGDAGVDIVAPDNAIAAYPDAYEPGTTKSLGQEAALAEFGGTSGAGPEVAGIAALLFQAHPGEGAEKIRARLLGAAKLDGSLVALPESDRGKGRVFIDLPLIEGAAPKITLAAPKRARAGDEVVIGATIVDEAAQLTKIRWDVDADGSFDAWGSETMRALRQPQHGPLDVLVEVVDAEGQSGRAIVRVDADTSTPPKGSGGSAGLGPPPPIAVAPREPPVEATGGDCGCALAPTAPTGIFATSLAALCVVARRRRR